MLFSSSFASDLQSGKSINLLIRRASEYLQNQLLIVDRMMQIIAKSDLEPRRPDPIWEEICHNDRLPEHVVSKMAPLYQAEKTSRRDLHSRLDKGIELYGTPNVHVDLRSEGIYLGWLILIGNRTELKEGMLELFSRLSSPFSFLMKIRHEEHKPDLAFDEYTWRELLAGRLHDPVLIKSLIRKHGWQHDDIYRVFQLERVDEYSPANRPSKAEIKRFNANAIILPGDYSLTMVEKLAARTDQAVFIDQLAGFLDKHRLIAGASDINSGADRLSVLRTQAEIALRERAEPAFGRISFYHDASARHLLELSDIKHIQPVFLHPAVIRLRAGEPMQSRRNMITLRVYLECERQLAPAAKRLDIHKNTLLYRIGRLSETFDLKLDDETERFRLLLSLKMIMAQEPG